MPNKAQLTRNLKQAREAYIGRDVDASRRAHLHPVADAGAGEGSVNPSLTSTLLECFAGDHNEPHSKSGEYIKSVVFGGLDGIVTIFASVAGCIGARLSPTEIIIVGFSNLLADALSMGIGEYSGARAETEYFLHEFKREKWELDNCPEGEIQEMEEHYVTKYKFSQEDARKLVSITFKYPEFFLAHMMTEELGLVVPEDEGPGPVKKGVVMFTSFIAFGLIPLLSYGLCVATLNYYNWTDFKEGHIPMAVCCITVGIALFILGAAKGSYTGHSTFVAGISMTFNGLLASIVAYVLGSFLQGRLGTSYGG